jgi:hypothetical protein
MREREGTHRRLGALLLVAALAGGVAVFVGNATAGKTVFRPVVRAGQSGVYAAWDEGDAEVGNGQIWEIPLFGGRNREVMFRAQPGVDPDLILNRVSAIQVVHDQAKLVAGMKTLVQAVITNGFDHEVQTSLELTYDPGTGTETTLLQPVTLPRGTTTLYLPGNDFLLPSGTAFRAEVTVDPDHTVTEIAEDNNFLEYSAMVATTRPFRVLFVPVQIGSDPAVTGPTLARIKEEASSFLQAILPVAESDFHSSFSYPSIVRMPPPANGARLSDTEFDNLVIVLDLLAGMAQVDRVVAVTRPDWFRDLAPPFAARAAGL